MLISSEVLPLANKSTVITLEDSGGKDGRSVVVRVQPEKQDQWEICRD